MLEPAVCFLQVVHRLLGHLIGCAFRSKLGQCLADWQPFSILASLRRVVWVNQVEETGFQYDLRIEELQDEDVRPIFDGHCSPHVGCASSMTSA